MMQLMIDVGNSRIKYAELRDGRLGPVSARAHDGRPAAALESILATSGVSRVVMVDVTGEGAKGAERHVPVTRVQATAEAFGVRNAYSSPGLLGADRWAALIAARGLTLDAVCVVDAGSALTVDLMDAGGQHLGGWITPGLRMSVNALSSNTRQVRVDGGGFTASVAPGTTTEEAVRNGAINAAVGMVERALRQYPGKLFLTGGDAGSLAALIPHAEQMPDLVLHGLVRWAGDGAE